MTTAPLPNASAQIEAALAGLGEDFGGVRTTAQQLQAFVYERDLTASELDSTRIEDLYLACACAQGDNTAVALFCQRHGPELRRVGGKVLGVAVVDDFMQAALSHLFVRNEDAPARIASYRGTGPLRSFVRMVATRLAIDRRRSARGEQVEPVVELDEQLLGDLGPMGKMEGIEVKRLLATALGEAMEQLRPTERRALRMRYLLGFSVARTAQALGLHEVSVSRLVRRVRTQLLQQIQRSLASVTGVQSSSALAAFGRSLDVSLAHWLRSQPDNNA